MYVTLASMSTSAWSRPASWTTPASVLHRERFALNRRTLEQFATKVLRPTDHVALEATTNCWAVADVLRPHVAKVVVSNPMATKAIAQAKVKTDKVDAYVLAQLLRCDFLPEVWQPDEATRRLRELTGRRSALVSQRTMMRNRIHSVLAMRLVETPLRLFNAAGLHWLKTVPLDDQARLLVDSDLRQLEFLQEQNRAALDQELARRGHLGPLMFVRGRYGHGGRVGYDREWRADPRISGGGELLDQGSHLIDLARWFLGDFPRVVGIRGDDVLGHAGGGQRVPHAAHGQGNRVAWLHVSCSEWKNLFSFEIYGRDGKLAIDGLGGSYGTERLPSTRCCRRWDPRRRRSGNTRGRYLLGNRVPGFKTRDQGGNASRCPSGGRGRGAGGDRRGVR